MVVAVPARVRRLARDQGWGKPVARYHTIRPLSGLLPMLLTVLAGVLGGVLGAALGGWFFWVGPALALLLIPPLHRYRLPASQRRSFYLYDKGVIVTSLQGSVTGVPWAAVTQVQHRPKSRGGTVNRVYTVHYEILRLVLRTGPTDIPFELASLAGLVSVVDLWPVAFQPRLTQAVRDRVRNSVTWTAPELRS